MTNNIKLGSWVLAFHKQMLYVSCWTTCWTWKDWLNYVCFFLFIPILSISLACLVLTGKSWKMFYMLPQNRSSRNKCVDCWWSPEYFLHVCARNIFHTNYVYCKGTYWQFMLNGYTFFFKRANMAPGVILLPHRFLYALIGYFRLELKLLNEMNELHLLCCPL